MPPRTRRSFALSVAAVIVVSGCASPDSLTAPPTATASAPSSASAPAPPTPAAKPTCPAVDLKAKPAITWRNALSALDSAGTSTYRLQTETAWRDGHVTVSRTVKVDVERQLAEHSASVGAKGVPQGPMTERITAVVHGDHAYLTIGSWTGARAGKWMRLKASVADAELPFELPAVDTVPAEIINFVPDTVRARHGQTLVHGRVPAVAAVSALGLNQLLLEDGAPAGSLSGHLGVTARLDNNGCLEYVEFFGENTRIKGSTKDAPANELDAVIRASLSRLFVSAVNSPQTITVPDPDSLIGSERV